jgi:hypothetical protein
MTDSDQSFDNKKDDPHDDWSKNPIPKFRNNL